MTLAWGAKVRGRRRHPGPIFFQAAEGQGAFCALTGRAAFLFRRNPGESDVAIAKDHDPDLLSIINQIDPFPKGDDGNLDTQNAADAATA
jgi:hypothetical protein